MIIIKKYLDVNRRLNLIEEKNSVFFRIIRSINRIFYRHLCNWIIFGRISDPCGEFFVCDGVSADENFQYSKDIAVFDHGKGSESVSHRTSCKL